MNGRPKNHRALLLAVAYVQHPDLDGVDSAILLCLVANGDHGTGRNCRPGNDALEIVAKLKWSALHVRLERLIEHGLIKRTERGDGRGRASKYDLCLGNPAYPDYAPTRKRECLIDSENGKPSGNPSGNPSGKHAKPSGENAETIRPASENHPVDGAKPSGLDRMTPPPHQTHTTPPPPTEASGPKTGPLAEKDGGGGGASSPNQDPATRLDKAIAKWKEKMGQPSPGEKEKLLQLARDPEFRHALNTFVADKLASDLGFAGLNHPWALFIKQFDDMKAEYALAVEKEANRQKEYAAAIARDIEESRRLTPKKPPTRIGKHGQEIVIGSGDDVFEDL
jgi:hypothetical protein